MRTSIIWRGQQPKPPVAVEEAMEDVLITFDPSEGFSERAGKVWLTPWVDPESWSQRRKPTALEVRAYLDDLSEETCSSLETLLAYPCVASIQMANPKPGWAPLGLEGLTPGQEYSFVILAHF